MTDLTKEERLQDLLVKTCSCGRISCDDNKYNGYDYEWLITELKSAWKEIEEMKINIHHSGRRMTKLELWLSAELKAALQREKILVEALQSIIRMDGVMGCETVDEAREALAKVKDLK